MKKIDLHIHTVPTVSDHTFVFSIDRLKQYISDNCIDAIAITNHNLFDRMQYESICTALDITVFPGIEVDLANGHLLVITNANDLDDFERRCSRIYAMNGASIKRFISD